MSRPKKGEPGYAEFRERENARQREHRATWASRGRGRTIAWRESHREEMNAYQRAAKNTENAFGVALAIEDGLHKRDKQSAAVNAAAMREALTGVRAVLQKWYCPDNGTMGHVVKLRAKCDAALSAPARNCDRPECADVESAWATCCAETNRADCKGFARWLLAPAKGGDHA